MNSKYQLAKRAISTARCTAKKSNSSDSYTFPSSVTNVEDTQETENNQEKIFNHRDENYFDLEKEASLHTSKWAPHAGSQRAVVFLFLLYYLKLRAQRPHAAQSRLTHASSCQSCPNGVIVNHQRREYTPLSLSLSLHHLLGTGQ